MLEVSAMRGIARIAGTARRVARRRRAGSAGSNQRDQRHARPLSHAIVLLALAGLGLASTAAHADHLNMALGADGQLYSVTAGSYGSLFPGSHTYPAATPVLALDTTVPGSPPKRQLVQSSWDGDTESSPALIYEDGSKTLFVVWVATTHDVSSDIKLTSYSGGQWTPAIDIISNPYALKTPPQLAVSRDTHQEVDPASGNPVTRHRTVLHIVWSEDSASGLYQAYYAPVIFEEGAWIGTVPVPIHLNTFDASEQTASGGPFATPLVYTPAVESGRDTSTVVAGFASEASGMLTTVEVDMLPEELRILADLCAATVLNNGANFPSQLGAIADQVQAAMVANGSFFQPEALQAIVAQVRVQILAGAPDLNHLSLKSRGTVIETGRKFSLRGLRPVLPTPAPVAPPMVTEIIPPGGPSQFIQFRVASARQWPTVGANSLQMFLSRTGSDVLAAWTSADNGSVLYSSTQPDGSWSNVYQLQLSITLDLQHAYQVLEQRIHF
jgi:hypothetical protein